MNWLVEPWTWGAWMPRAMLAGCLVAVSCSLLGVFLYLRRMSMLADAFSHVALPGIVVAFLLTSSLSTGPLLIGATISGLATAAAIGAISRQQKVREEAAIGIVFTSLFALGVVLLSTLARDAHIDANCVLFGNMLGVTDASLVLLAIVTVVVVLFVALMARWLVASTFDAVGAAVLGLPVAALHYAILTLVSVTTVASFEAVGAILVLGMMVLPAATAHQLARSMRGMVGWALAHALLSTVVGIYAAVWFDVAAAGTIVSVGGVFYAAAIIGRLVAARTARRNTTASLAAAASTSTVAPA